MTFNRFVARRSALPAVFFFKVKFDSCQQRIAYTWRIINFHLIIRTRRQRLALRYCYACWRRPYLHHNPTAVNHDFIRPCQWQMNYTLLNCILAFIVSEKRTSYVNGGLNGFMLKFSRNWRFNSSTCQFLAILCLHPTSRPDSVLLLQGSLLILAYHKTYI